MKPYIHSKLTRRLLAHFFTHPTESYYVRQLAYLLTLDPGNLSKALRVLAKEGLFLSETKGRERFYRLNRSYPLYDELKGMVSKTEGMEGRLRELFSGFRKVRLAFIYGSFSEGRETGTSDVDLLIVGKPDRDKLTAQLRRLESHLKREINFSLYDPVEFRSKKRQKGSFLQQIIQGKKVLLKGNLDETSY